MPHKTIHRLLDESLFSLAIKGNHDAFEELKARYHRHGLILCTDLLNQYINTGITKKELCAVCDDCFTVVFSKYSPSFSSFYTYWKESALHDAMGYLVENSYGGQGSYFSGAISLNQDGDNRYCLEDVLSEKDVSLDAKRFAFEIKAILARYEKFFTVEEKALINLALAGYTISDLEATGLYGRTQLYLTFKNALEKLKKYFIKLPKNKK